ncbi:Streptomyces sporulation and cell division protein, SsgA [Amycolatopsis tolypomycina]|uniref:Streptomyces sporulation and cell division protein, SsgA n=1 Tax=Amycolatopsis tolypomycina TaxID=208445 RepID=A0A1H4JAA5_9PSEU|nr:SsgA family sporulation/cell division regulator [Amycolatopsis tolypomycina]SEB43240.1 Streptomyces sporulation and cell division protein, SsgA [Amycolatopsis tolypomycina]
MTASDHPVSYFTTAVLLERRQADGQRTRLGERVGVELRYLRNDPFAVTLLIDYAHASPGDQAEWRFARRMLAAARTVLVGGPGSDVAIAPCPCRRHVEFGLADRAAGHGYRLGMTAVDVNAALLVFDQIVALDAEPHIAPNLDEIGAELRAMLAAETGRGGDR